MELIECNSFGRPTDIIRQRTISVYEIDEEPEHLNSNCAVILISVLACVVFIGILVCLLL